MITVCQIMLLPQAEPVILMLADRFRPKTKASADQQRGGERAQFHHVEGPSSKTP